MSDKRKYKVSLTGSHVSEEPNNNPQKKDGANLVIQVVSETEGSTNLLRFLDAGIKIEPDDGNEAPITIQGLQVQITVHGTTYPSSNIFFPENYVIDSTIGQTPVIETNIEIVFISEDADFTNSLPVPWANSRS